MEQIADSSIWIDYLRPTTKPAVKAVADEVLSSPSLVLCDPIWFELLRLAPLHSRKMLEETLSAVPMLSTPAKLWQQAAKNGQHCRDKGIQTGSLDLLIATICLFHEVELITFDAAFEKIGKALGFQVKVLKRIS